MRKFTFNEVTRMLGRLQLSTIAYFCEICDRKKRTDMVLVTKDYIPICICAHCATELLAATIAQRNAIQKADTVNGVTNGKAVKRRYTRKATK